MAQILNPHFSYVGDGGFLLSAETFEKGDIFLSGKEGKNFNRRNTLCISRIKIRSLTPHHEKMTVLQGSLSSLLYCPTNSFPVMFVNALAALLRTSLFLSFKAETNGSTARASLISPNASAA